MSLWLESFVLYTNTLSMSVNFERTFWYPQILPKNERTNSSLVLLGKKTNLFVRFLEESSA